MLTMPLQPRRALGRGLALLRQQPLPLLGFSAAAWGLHGLGWALVAAGDRLPSAVLGALLRGVGIVLYGGGLLWLVEGLSRAGLALAAGQRPHWRELYRWHGRSSRRLAWGLLNLVAALAFTALVGFVGWSLMVFLLPCLASAAEKQREEAEKQAVVAAEAWLAQVDQAKYGEAWESAAGFLKKVVEKGPFAKSLANAREPLGKLKSRELKSKHYATSLPGAPDGEYVVIQFKTVFENKASAIETITPMLDKDKVWRVSGYFIK